MLMREDLLLDFCRSIDAMDKSSFDKFRNIAVGILRDEFGTIHSDIKLDGRRADGVPALDTIRLDSRPDDHGITTIFKRGKYTSQRAFSYHQGCPLWVTTKCGKPIAQAKHDDVLIEQWGSFDGKFSAVKADIPPYQDFVPTGGGARTSVIVPLRYGFERPRIFGVLCLEFEKKIDLTKHSAGRIGRINKAIAKAIWLFETSTEQKRGTNTALDTLEERLKRLPTGPGLEMPSIFFACGSNADSDVRDIIVNVLTKYPEVVQLDDWEKHAGPGPVNQQIADSINKASYGIVYFSEPCPDGSRFQYRDNPNVLFEAGMMNSVFHNSSDGISRWVLVREDHDGESPLCGPPPFDFFDQKIVIVPRSAKKLSKREFATQLKNHLEALIFRDAKR